MRGPGWLNGVQARGENRGHEESTTIATPMQGNNQSTTWANSGVTAAPIGFGGPAEVGHEQNLPHALQEQAAVHGDLQPTRYGPARYATARGRCWRTS